MSRLNLKYLILIGLLLILPKIAFGKVLVYQEKQWEVKAKISGLTEDLGIRNDFDLSNLARAQILGQHPAQTQPLLDTKTIEYLEEIASQINQQPRSAKLVIENNKALEFDPGQLGQALDLYHLKQLILGDGSKVALPVLIAYPAYKLADTNNLGITELVAVGESNFAGSPRNRIHNIAVGAAKFNGVIVAPGGEFSFNKFLGDVDEANGFLPELVIKKAGLIPEVGGGLCQVSSTTFRAAMNAGLPITERRNHSFPVRYYSPQGTDATIYPGVTDLRFTNNLTSHLLIWTRKEGNKLYFDFYGTKDDRKIIFDDPYQYDKKEDGSMKAVWTRTVTLNGEESKQVFRSNYLSPDLFPKITEVVASIPNP